MNDYIFFMHKGVDGQAADGATWEDYFAKLRSSGQFQGGSSIGEGVCVSKSNQSPEVTSHLTGYIRVRANSIEDARTLLDGNPVFEAGGTVEIRELPRD